MTGKASDDLDALMAAWDAPQAAAQARGAGEPRANRPRVPTPDRPGSGVPAAHSGPTAARLEAALWAVAEDPEAPAAAKVNALRGLGAMHGLMSRTRPEPDSDMSQMSLASLKALAMRLIEGKP